MTCIGFALGFAYFTCTGPEIQVPAARYCELGTLFRYSARDTAETRRQLRIANARYRTACPGR